ncbi:MAG TPA: HAD-IA family hydrolase [Acidimicrobiales bacterium]|nr:HAD-IA family hydrolase [Acidimicrobiales bacterium]
MRLVVFDIDGVIYRYDRNRRLAALARAVGRTADEVRAAMFTSGVEDAGDAGDLGPDDYLRAIGHGLGTDVSRDAWAAARAAAMTPDREVLALVAAVARRLPAATLSNNGELLGQEAARIVPDLVAVEGLTILMAGELGSAKPSVAVFHTVVERFGVAPGEALFVDDSDANVAGAGRAGLRTRHFAGAADLEAWLRREGALPPVR